MAISEPRRRRTGRSQARWIDWFGALFGHDKAAEIRWKRSNDAAFEKGCPCGKPSEMVHEDHGTYGRVPYQAWTCVEHFGASSWSTVEGVSTPSWDRPQRCSTCWMSGDPPEGVEPTRCTGWGGPINGPTTYWSCPKRPEVP